MKLRVLAILLPLLVTACGNETEQPAADTVFINGKVLTVDDDFSVAEPVVEIFDINPVLTMVGGRVVFDSESESANQ